MSLAPLPEEALVPFDVEFRDWQPYRSCLVDLAAEHGPPGCILDLGGGNGRFLDAVLELFPEAEGVLVDRAASMLARNRPQPRKRTVCLGAEELPDWEPQRRFDLITVNLLLHHLVGPAYQDCRELALAVLRGLRHRLTERGQLVVFEQCYQARWPWLPSPGRIIHRLTAFRAWPLSALLRRLGANTAGVGVAFRSAPEWRGLLEEAGLEVVRERLVVADAPEWRDPLLNVGQCATVLFVAQVPAPRA